MEIEKIYPPYIYSIKYDDEDVNEFERLFENWRDLDVVVDFFEKNKEHLKSKVWSAVCEPEAAAYQVPKKQMIWKSCFASYISTQKKKTNRILILTLNFWMGNINLNLNMHQ